MKRKKTTILIDQETKKKILEKNKNNKVTIKEIVERILTEYLQKPLINREKKILSFTVEPGLYEQANEKAKKEKTSISEILRKGLEEYAERD